jgi:hypothetical protein
MYASCLSDPGEIRNLVRRDFEIEILSRFSYFVTDDSSIEEAIQMLSEATTVFPHSFSARMALASYLLVHTQDYQMIAISVNRAKRTASQVRPIDNDYYGLSFILDG